MRALLTTILFAVSAVAASDTYKVNIPNETWIGNTELKPGNYKIEAGTDKAILHKGKDVIEVPAKFETGAQKNGQTSLTIGTEGNKKVLKEIRIGGTTTTIVFK